MSILVPRHRVPAGPAGNTRDIPSWTRIDLGARVGFDVGETAMTMRAAVENLADRNYWQSTNRSFLTRGTARTARLTVEAAF